MGPGLDGSLDSVQQFKLKTKASTACLCCGRTLQLRSDNRQGLTYTPTPAPATLSTLSTRSPAPAAPAPHPQHRISEHGRRPWDVMGGGQ
jgi:hypothetical protein